MHSLAALRFMSITVHCTGLQVKISEYNTVKSQISAALRKAGGSLAVRDISTLVKPQQVIETENLTTLFVVVSKYSLKDWDATYEQLCEFVVSPMFRHDCSQLLLPLHTIHVPFKPHVMRHV